MSSPVTNFRGLRVVLLHRQDHNRDALESQLRRIGLLVICVAPLGGAGLPAADVIFFDADLGYEGLFPWDRNEPPVPLVAVLASEAPGRLEWALDQGATSYLLKPIGSTGAFNALVVAWRLYLRTPGHPRGAIRIVGAGARAAHRRACDHRGDDASRRHRGRRADAVATGGDARAAHRGGAVCADRCRRAACQPDGATRARRPARLRLRSTTLPATPTAVKEVR